MSNYGVRGNPNDRRSGRAIARAAKSSKFISSSTPTESIASAATVNLNYTTGELVSITGTVTITAFEESPDVGEWRFVTFTGILILTHNATSFILPGSGNIITAAGDTAEFYHEGDGNWKCVRYTRGGTPPTPGATKTANVRLTLESGVPVSTTDQTAKTTLYATPCGGNFMPVYNGTNWEDVVFTELSIQTNQSQNGTFVNLSPIVTGLTDTSKLFVGMRLNSATGTGLLRNIASIDSATQITMSGNAAATVTESVTFTIESTAPVDVFATTVSGVMTLRFSRYWTSQTARNDAISLLNGVYVNTNALTGSGNTTIAANMATYLGTIDKNNPGGSGTFYDSLAYRNIWNMFNRFPQPMQVTESTDSWSYSLAVYRQANYTNTSANKITFVRGLDDDMMESTVFSSVTSSTATTRNCRVGIGLDSVTVNSATVYDAQNISMNDRGDLKAIYKGYPGLGRHYLSWLERGGGIDTQTWSGDGGGGRQCGIIGHAFFAGGAGGGGGGTGGGSGTVTSVSVATNNGVSGTVATPTTTPEISLVLGNVTPDSVASVGTITGSNLSGTNTGDDTAADILAKILTVDGAGSGIDADLLDGLSSAAFQTAGSYQTLDATLTAFASLTIVAESLTIGTGADAFTQVTFADNTFPARSSLGSLVAKSITDFGLSLVDDADAATSRTTLGLAIGTNVQAFDAQLTSVAALDYTANAGKFMRVNSGETAFELVAISGGGDALTSATLAQFASTTSAQLRSVLSDESGTGAAYFQGGDLGTPSAGVLTNATGTASGLTAGNVTTNANLTGDVTSVGNASVLALGMLKGVLWGLGISNNVTDATNDIDIAIGCAADSTVAGLMQLTGALTKQLDAAWAVGTNQGGLDTGAIANTTYHVWLIRRPDTGVEDVLFSASATAPTMPTDYTQKCRIGSIIRLAGTILPFVQMKDTFLLQTPILNVDATNPGTSAVTRVLSVPLGIRVESLLNVNVTANGATGIQCYLSALSCANLVPSVNLAPIGQINAVPGTAVITSMRILTDTSAQIRTRLSVSGASDRFRIATTGWVDFARSGDA